MKVNGGYFECCPLFRITNCDLNNPYLLDRHLEGVAETTRYPCAPGLDTADFSLDTPECACDIFADKPQVPILNKNAKNNIRKPKGGGAGYLAG